MLLHALARLPHARGLIIGGHPAEPDLARTKSVADGLGIAERVAFTGLVEPARVAELLSQADVLVLPNPASAISTRYTSPLKLFEYMAAARPIVSSDLLASAIDRLLHDSELAVRLARAAFDNVLHYSWQRRAERLEALFTETIAAG